MLSPAQIQTVKMAQREAGLSDPEYREALGLFGAQSAKDRHLTDDHWDRILAYFEAIFWRKFDAGTIRQAGRVFRQRDYWKNKNFSGANSRERFNAQELAEEIVTLEAHLSELGCGTGYIGAIQVRTIGAARDAASLAVYAAALRRTLAAKQRKAVPA